MSYLIKFSNTASKQFQKLQDTKLKERVVTALEYIAKEPLIGKPLQAEFKGCYSYRIGDYRLAYTFYKEQKYIGIIRIEHRREVYR
ncbi:MAG: type II toxin-antitoxin system RelE/ParE family toxin [Candidatus Omnitrophota bacterium]|nr:type II toxin-antitoxin system RelE/ParE family toxin [Candidatus Omnitrophota bacterium]